MSDMDREEFGWEDEIEKDSQDFDPIPEGDYDFTVEKFERSRSKGGGKLPPCNMAVVYFRIVDRDREVTIKENFILHKSMEWKLSQLFRGLGMKGEGEKVRMNWPGIVGKTGRAKVGQQPGTKDPSKMFNYIDKIYPKEGKGFTAGTF